jgi:hypothetical protein
MTPESGLIVAVLPFPFITLLWPYTPSVFSFWSILLLLQQNQKYKVVNILVYLPHLDLAVRLNGKSGHVSRNKGIFPSDNLISTTIDVNVTANQYFHI